MRVPSVRILGAYALAGAVVASVAVQAQSPAGGEFRVSNGTAGALSASVAADASGAFVVTWTDWTAATKLWGRRYDPAGVPRGSAFVVNTDTSGYLGPQSVAADDKGRMMVVWRRREVPGVDRTIRGRVFDASGAPAGPEFMVSSPSVRAYSPNAAAARGGTFVVVWDARPQDGSYEAVVGRRFGPAGNPLGPQFTVNTYTSGPPTGTPFFPSVATDDAGGFVVVWTGYNDGSSTGVSGRRFDAAGMPLGTEFRVNASTAESQYQPQVAADGRGGFVVVWKYHPVPSAMFVVGRRFDASGSPLGGEFLVTLQPPSVLGVSVASDRAGNSTVLWEFPDGSSEGVFGQRFTAGGVPRGAEFRVNTTTADNQNSPDVATDGSGNLFAVWLSQELAPEVYGQRLGGLLPAGMTVTDGGNGVLEVPDDFALFTSWRNVSGAAQTFQGRASDIEVPQGLLLTLSLDASYGTVANGAVGSCTGPCFAGGLFGTRPSGHVDLGFVETIVPDVQGQAQRWAVHVGRSFTDVPSTSGFYRFVETLLHRGVTAGCTATTYCPASATTREQMSVFVLAAKEGAGYVPPACTTPVFNDVPAASPFCRWVEELARRGVTGGCGGGNYCPGAPVSREQMAVFVLRTLDPALNPPACTTPVFNDVPASSPFCRWIEELARRGIVSGCGGGNYCPTQPVTREQMSVFLTGTFGLTLYGP